MNIKPNTIFVSIASYRDNLCINTVKNLYETAYNPANVFVGICQQNDEKVDEDCGNPFEFIENVRIIRLPHTKAMGPTYARYICSTLWGGEEYFLQIDSHTMFIKNWDIECINMIKEIKYQKLSNKPVLSHYPRETKDYNINDGKITRMCKSFFNKRDILSFMGADILDNRGEYYQTPYVAAGFIFCESLFLLEVPFDPYLPYLFVGEEILLSIRLFTHGWDIFTPNKNVVYHLYTRQESPKIWNDNPHYVDIPAFNKVKYLIGLDTNIELENHVKIDIDKYGIGNIRSLQDYYVYAGIDIKERKVTKNFCKPDNIASDEDIRLSNEKNHKENFIYRNKHNSYKKNLIPLLFWFIIFMMTFYFLYKSI